MIKHVFLVPLDSSHYLLLLLTKLLVQNGGGLHQYCGIFCVNNTHNIVAYRQRIMS